jgi:predicted Zn-dependent peptidase
VADRSRLPAVGADAPFVFPAIRKTRLPNGLDVWSVEHGTLPIATMVLLVRAGSSADPGGRPGLASLTGDMLDEGAGDRDALGVHDALARIGAQFDTEVGPDATFLTLTTLGRFRPTGLGLLADLVRRPRFDEGEFERVRQLRANRLRQLRDIPSATADRAFAGALYGRHPYGHLAIGTIDALATMTLGDVRALHRRAYRPGRVVLVVVGGAPHAQVVDEIAAAFADWTDPPEAPVRAPEVGAPSPPAERMWMVDRAGAAQSELRLGHIGVPRTTPDYHALLLVNLVLGGQFVSRLNMNLREHKGYTYGARSWFEFRLGPGPFQMSASVQTEVTADAMREAIGEMAGIAGGRPITASELDTARATLTRGYPRNFETTDQMARSVAQLALYDLDDDYFAAFVPRVARLPLEVVRAAAADHLHPDQLTAVVVGDSARVAPTLESLGLGVPRTLEVP